MPAKLLIKLNQNGADAISVDESLEELEKLMANNIIFAAHVEGDKRLFNREYVTGVVADNSETTSSPNQLL